MNCIPVTPASKDKKRCNHGPGGKCIYCTKSKGEDIEWLCNHPPDQMCSNCMPIEKDEKVELEMLCLHGDNAVCTNCLPPPPISNAPHISYQQYINDEISLCQHPHDGKNICVHCIPPEEINYKIKQGCTRHPPYPNGLCSACEPPPATLKRQKYRHVDYVEFLHVDAFNKFLLPWSNTGRVCQRMGIMIGKFEDDPNYQDGKKAVVQEIYEPNQDFSNGKITLLDDYLLDQAMPYLNELGLKPVGWIFTHESRDYVIGSDEMEMIYKMQSTYKNQKTGLSEFVTVTVSYNEKTKQVAPEAFMLSDQGMALYRDEIIGQSSDPHVCVVRKPRSKFDYVTTVLRNDKELGTQPCTKFEPEFLLVVVNCGAPKVTDNSCYIYPYEDFTPIHRDIFGELPSDDEFAACLRKRQNESCKWKIFGDFHMFMYALTNYEESFTKSINTMIKNKSKCYIDDVDTFVLSLIQ